MQYEARTPEEFLSKLDNDWRKQKLQQVRELIRQSAPGLDEGIEYKMLCYKDGDKSVFHLNAQSAYVSLYVGSIDKVDNAKQLLQEFDRGKGCIRIKKSINLSDTRIGEFIDKTMQIWREGGETNC